METLEQSLERFRPGIYGLKDWMDLIAVKDGLSLEFFDNGDRLRVLSREDLVQGVEHCQRVFHTIVHHLLKSRYPDFWNNRGSVNDKFTRKD